MSSKNPISALQELMMAKKLPLPSYTEEPNGFNFKCTVEVAGVRAIGIGANKKAAKTESARLALEKLKHNMPKLTPQIVILETSSPPVLIDRPQKNYVGELNEFSSKNDVKYPSYQECGTGTSSRFYTKCLFLGQEVLGIGINKKDAKQDAAKKMLELIRVKDPSSLISDARFRTLGPIRTTLNIPKHDEVIEMYNRLSVTGPTIVVNNNNNTWEAAPDIQLEEEDTIDIMNAKLKHYGIEYTVTHFPQNNPYVSSVRIKGTNLHFCGYGVSEEEATRKALKQVLQVKKSGCSLDTNDLMSFTD